MHKIWFKVYGDAKFYTNGVKYETEHQAIVKAREKFNGWTQAQSWVVMAAGVDPNKNEAAKFSAPRDICPPWENGKASLHQYGINPDIGN